MYSPSITDLIEPYQNCPKTIQKAIALVHTQPRFLGLTRHQKAVVASLVSRCNQRSGLIPIRARLDRVADQVEVSTKTVQRTLTVLREAGWMQQVSDGRSEMGCFTFRHYQFSPEFCDLVELPHAEKKPPEASVSDGSIEVELTFEDQRRKISKEKRQGKPVDLPPALQEITTYGIKDTGVAKLRGIAHAAGHRLEDVWQVAKERIEAIGATAGRLYRYLQAMIGKVSDYAARASQIERVATQVVEVTQTLARRLKHAHKRFSAGPGTIVKIYDGIAEVIRDGKWVANIAGLGMETVYDDIERGKLNLQAA